MLDRLNAIALAREAGFSIAETRTLVRGFDGLECDCLTLEDCRLLSS